MSAALLLLSAGLAQSATISHCMATQLSTLGLILTQAVCLLSSSLSLYLIASGTPSVKPPIALRLPPHFMSDPTLPAFLL